MHVRVGGAVCGVGVITHACIRGLVGATKRGVELRRLLARPVHAWQLRAVQVEATSPEHRARAHSQLRFPACELAVQASCACAPAHDLPTM